MLHMHTAAWHFMLQTLSIAVPLCVVRCCYLCRYLCKRTCTVWTGLRSLLAIGACDHHEQCCWAPTDAHSVCSGRLLQYAWTRQSRHHGPTKPYLSAEDTPVACILAADGVQFAAAQLNLQPKVTVLLTSWPQHKTLRITDRDTLETLCTVVSKLSTDGVAIIPSGMSIHLCLECCCCSLWQCQY